MLQLRSFNYRSTKPLADLGPGAWLISLGALCSALFLSITPVHAQGLTRQNAGISLRMALARLNHNPRDTEALIAAGNAALAMGDTDAAVGFFTRADRLSPANPRIEAGLAGAEVHAEDPFSAIPLFIAAEKGGTVAPELLGDRGLAYDLIGDNANAQQYYRQALAGGATAEVNAEISRRLALSLAIRGNRLASETVLSPLLQKQDRAAWRTRIFALAILGYEEEAVATANSTMPPDMAIQMAPYLRYMRRLTTAQQAAAANLGHFPQAAEIGHDDPRVAQYARTLDRSLSGSTRPGAGGIDQGLVPAGAPLGSSAPAPLIADKSAGKRRKDKKQVAAVTSLVGAAVATPRPDVLTPSNPPLPEIVVSRETQSAAPSLLPSTRAPLGSPNSLEKYRLPEPTGPARLVSAPPQRVAVASSMAMPVIQPLPTPATSPHATGQFITPSASPPVSTTPAPTPRRAAPVTRPSFSEAFAAMSPVMVDITPERGAVDLRRIDPARAAPKLPPPPSHPSRIWVELGVGRDTDRLAFDWRRMVKADPDIFKGKNPFVSSWARTNRLLIGPFETDRAANAFTEKLHRSDHASAFVWTSPAGQVVDPLDGQ